MFKVHRRPHHVHVETSCSDHTSCPEEHWKGGRPERDHPHHVEIDCQTGRVGYTRLSAQEIAANEARFKAAGAAQEEQRRRVEADVFLLREMAEKDQSWAALLRHMGIVS